MIVHPGAKTEWWMFRSLALNEKPAKTGETVIVWPLGKCTRLGAIIINRSEHGTLVIACIFKKARPKHASLSIGDCCVLRTQIGSRNLPLPASVGLSRDAA